MLLVGGLVATVAEAFARVNLLGQLVAWHLDWGQWPWAWSVSWLAALQFTRSRGDAPAIGR